MEELVVIRKSELIGLIEDCVRRVLKEKTKDQEQQISNRLDTKQVSKFTGYKLNTIYRLVHDKKIPYHKTQHGGRKLIFYKEEIQEWLKVKKPETNEEYCERMEDVLLNSRRNKIK